MKTVDCRTGVIVTIVNPRIDTPHIIHNIILHKLFFSFKNATEATI